jgi:hypothetical protein
VDVDCFVYLQVTSCDADAWAADNLLEGDLLAACNDQVGFHNVRGLIDLDLLLTLRPLRLFVLRAPGGSEALARKRASALHRRELPGVRRREISQIYLYRRNFIGGFYGDSETFLRPRKTTA